MPELERDAETFDPRGRRLCPDGNCIGVIGPDGRCKVCGLSDGGGPATAEAFPGGGAADALDEEESAGADASDAEASLDDALDGGAFDPSRKLCVDGGCIGVIGPDGRCTECGRSAEG
jgi:hypothetical protein